MNSMDGDVELQPEEELSVSRPATACGQGEGRLARVEVEGRLERSPANLESNPNTEDENREQAATGDEDSNDDDEEDDDEEEDDDDDDDESEEGDTTDGAPPPMSTIHEQVYKRPHVQSKRMQEYHADMQRMTSHQRLFPCKFCHRTFNSAPGLRYHTQQKHYSGNESFTCDKCHKVFKSNNGLKYHRKKNRCQGHPSSTAFTLTDTPASRIPRPLTLPGAQDCGNQRLMELAHIATGPQSPLLRSSQDQWKCHPSADDSPETSAVMALSTMAERSKQSRRVRASPEERAGTPLSTGIKSKRPMNGFLLFAQKHRAAFNKKFSLNNRIISTKLSEAWNKLSVHERESWKEEAKKKAEQQRLENPDCWKRKKYSKDTR